MSQVQGRQKIKSNDFYLRCLVKSQNRMIQLNSSTFEIIPPIAT